MNAMNTSIVEMLAELKTVLEAIHRALEAIDKKLKP